jgi:hypothetical protein
MGRTPIAPSLGFHQRVRAAAVGQFSSEQKLNGVVSVPFGLILNTAPPEPPVKS